MYFTQESKSQKHIHLPAVGHAHYSFFLLDTIFYWMLARGDRYCSSMKLWRPEILEYWLYYDTIPPKIVLFDVTLICSSLTDVSISLTLKTHSKDSTFLWILSTDNKSVYRIDTIAHNSKSIVIQCWGYWNICQFIFNLLN